MMLLQLMLCGGMELSPSPPRTNPGIAVEPLKQTPNGYYMYRNV
jgi:hypothetical protein